MKVKDLIKELEGVNPEAEVIVDGSAVWCEGQLPGYYDGPYSEAILDERGRITGIRYTRRGDKFKLRKIYVDDAIFDEPDDFTVEWDEQDAYFSPEDKEKARLIHEAIRWEGRQCEAKYSELYDWFPLKKYELAENPHKEHLPEDWE